MKRRLPRQIILTHWNAGVFDSSTVSQLLPELLVYSLLYDEVLIREEDLLTNHHIVRLLGQPTEQLVFAELLAAGLVKLLRLSPAAYVPGRRFDPEYLPISARVEEHELRRSYKGKPWKPTSKDWRVFRYLDRVIVDNPGASRFHAPFPPENLFAEQLAELLDKRREYRLNRNSSFRLHPGTADKFIELCREPEAWQRFLRDAGAKNVITGPDGGFYRSAAYQCSYLLPTPRPIQRLVESVYAAIYCEREKAEGRYGGSNLIELPYRYSSNDEQIDAKETITRIGIVPTAATATIVLCPGIAAALALTRQSAEFEHLQRAIGLLGSTDPYLFPTESVFREAWHQVCAVYTHHAGPLLHALTRSSSDIALPRYTAVLYLLARVLGYLVVPEGPWDTHPAVAADHAVTGALEHLGPKLLNGFRAALGAPRLTAALANTVRVRSSKVLLNKVQKGPSSFSVESNNHNGWS